MDRNASPMEILIAREQRAERQIELIRQYHKPLVSFSLNIAGPQKNTPLIRKGYALGKELFEEQLLREKLSVIYFEESDEVTGCEGIFVVDGNEYLLKQMVSEIEEGSMAGRLFDFDVLVEADAEDQKAANGLRKLERSEIGLPKRRCLICGGPAKECARSRAHALSLIEDETSRILKAAILDASAKKAASFAVRALLYEVCTTPKPGLVDRMGNGSHSDMDIYTFMDSSSVLFPYFEGCYRIGFETATQAPEETFAALRPLGKVWEGHMLSATHGINTHKGAIFTSGIVCGAIGRLEANGLRGSEVFPTSGELLPCSAQILAECACMTRGLTASDFSGIDAAAARTAGQRLYAAYGITGVRGQAEAGFPSVLNYGLPTLQKGISLGKSLEEAGCAALLSMLAHTIDTNMISRSDAETARKISAELLRLLEDHPFPEPDLLKRLDGAFVRQNLSPGGSADLLAICYLLWFYHAGQGSVKAGATRCISAGRQAARSH